MATHATLQTSFSDADADALLESFPQRDITVAGDPYPHRETADE
jgi:hypothetical protein